MVHKEQTLSKKHKILAFTLILLTFVMGTSEFVIVGLLTEVSTSIGISIATAGTLVSGFAIAYAIGTPIVTGFVSRFPKYPLMLVLIAIFILGNIISALSSTYVVLMGSRITTAVVSGVLTALSMSIANTVIPKEKRSTIIASIFAGFTIANVMGVPLGTMIGQWSNWHMTFWLTAFLGDVAFIISMFVLPKRLSGENGSLSDQLSLLKHPKVILAFLIPIFTIAGTYTIYTFITPILENKLGVPTKYIAIVLLIYGFFSIFSNVLAGKIAQRNGLSKLRYIFIIQAFILFSFYFTMSSLWLGILSILLMAVILYAVNATIQLYFMDLAEEYSPSAKDFASSLTPVAVNVGIALGAAIGGFVINSGSLEYLAWAAATLALIASAFTSMSYRRHSNDPH